MRRLLNLSLLILLVLMALAIGCDSAQEPATSTTSETSSTPATSSPEPTASSESTAAGEDRTASSVENGTSSSDGSGVSLQLVTPEGFQNELEKHRGKVVLVDFWATWCIPCVKQFPHTVELSRKYADKNFAVISMSLDDAEQQQDVLEFLQQHNARFTNLLSLTSASEAFEAYDLEAVPYYRIYDRDGQVQYQFGGELDEHQLEPEIEKLLEASSEAADE